MNQQPLLCVDDLSVHFKTKYGSAAAVNHISFSMEKGEKLGLVGESGSGKSVTSKSIIRLLASPPAYITGSIRLNGEELLTMSERQMCRIRGNKISMIFQEPMVSLDPLFPIGDQLGEVVRLHKHVSSEEADKLSIEMLRTVGIPSPETRLKQYPFELSGGMRQRVMIAMALLCNPELLIADEPTTALDVTIQHQILKQMRSLQEEYGTSIIFITHDLGVVAELCDRVVVLYGGLVMEEAEINDLFENPLHPYTMGLLASIPGLTKDKSERLQSIPGSPPDMTKPPKGCPFASRCQFARNICAAECPPFVQVGSRQARCWLLQPDAPAEGNPLHEKLAEAERKAH